MSNLPLCAQSALKVAEQKVGVLEEQLERREEAQKVLETLREELKNANDKVREAEQEAWEAKLSRDEGRALCDARETELVMMREREIALVTEIRQRHDFAEKIKENWRVIKATVEQFNCGEVAPREFLPSAKLLQRSWI